MATEGEVHNPNLGQQMQIQHVLQNPSQVQMQAPVAAAPQQIIVVQVPPPVAAPPKAQRNQCFTCCIIGNITLFLILAVVCIWALANGVYIDDFSSYTEEGLQTMYIVFIAVAGIFSLVFVIYAYAQAKGKTDSAFWTLGTFSMISNISGLSIGLFCCLCTCFSADSMVWVAKTNIDIIDPAADSNLNNDIVHLMPLRDIEIGDWLLTMDPWTNNVFWDEIKLKIHYSWYDNAKDYYSMRKLILENNISSITLSDDHFIFIEINNEPNVVQAGKVNIGDSVYHYDYNTQSQSLQKIIEIEENVMTQKRVVFTMSPYLLVDNIVASPYIGPHPIYHTILHNSYSFGMQFVSTHPYIWSIFSVFGYFIIYGSFYVVSHLFEWVVVMVSTFYVVSVIYRNLTNKK